MNKVLKKGLILGSIGFVVGLMIGLTIFLISVDDLSNYHFTFRDALDFLVGGIFGGFAMGFSAVYDIESWSIARCTLTHFVPTILGFYLLGTIQGWLKIGDTLSFIMTFCYILAYFMIWLIQYLRYRKEVRNLNAKLKEIKNRNEKESTDPAKRSSL